MRSVRTDTAAFATANHGLGDTVFVLLVIPAAEGASLASLWTPDSACHWGRLLWMGGGREEFLLLEECGIALGDLRVRVVCTLAWCRLLFSVFMGWDGLLNVC